MTSGLSPEISVSGVVVTTDAILVYPLRPACHLQVGSGGGREKAQLDVACRPDAWSVIWKSSGVSKHRFLA